MGDKLSVARAGVDDAAAAPTPDHRSDAHADAAELRDAVEELRTRLGALHLPLALAGIPAARRDLAAVLDQLDDYVLPRLRALDSPLLAVVTGPTGAGKSTLVNALAREVVTISGVLRPTTRSPVLVAHPDDVASFAADRVLRGLARVDGRGDEPSGLHVVGVDGVPAGIALVDAPDLDSVVSANRQLAEQLMSAADLWLFVTSAARYADAVPWQALRGAARRGTAVAAVLDRVSSSAMGEITMHFAGMLEANGLGRVPLFVVPETSVADSGVLPAEAVAGLRDWLVDLAADARSRTTIAWQSLHGTVTSVCQRVGALAALADAQVAAAAELRSDIADAYAAAADAIAAVAIEGRDARDDVGAVVAETVAVAVDLAQEAAAAMLPTSSGAVDTAALTADVRAAIEAPAPPTPRERIEAVLARAAAAMADALGAAAVDPEAGPAIRAALRRVETAR
jgi:energy-coupling factor transporter ATP-binding protein EcfA2